MKDTATREGAASAQRPLALIAAGGEGKRLGSIGPKALVRCADRSLLEWCLDAFVTSETFGEGAGLVVVAAHASDLPAFEQALVGAREAGLDVVLVAGGPSRSHSVAAALRRGLESVSGADPVFVHDAARIFVTPELIDRLAAALAAHRPEVEGVTAASRVVDTIKLADAQGMVAETPPRERLWAVQTPQVFRREAIAAALGLTTTVSDEDLASATDDCSLVERRGGQISVLEWALPNGKITTPDDLASAPVGLRQRGF